MGETTAAGLLCEFKVLNNLAVLSLDVDQDKDKEKDKDKDIKTTVGCYMILSLYNQSLKYRRLS